MKKTISFFLASILILSGIGVAGASTENNVLNLDISVDIPIDADTSSANVLVNDDLNLAHSASIENIYASFAELHYALGNELYGYTLYDTNLELGSEDDIKDYFDYSHTLGSGVANKLWNNPVCFAEKSEGRYTPVTRLEPDKTYAVFVVAVDSLLEMQNMYLSLIRDFKTATDNIPSYNAYRNASDDYYLSYVDNWHTDTEVAEAKQARDEAYAAWKADSEGQAKYAALYSEFDRNINAVEKVVSAYSGIRCTINGHEAECYGFVYSYEFTLCNATFVAGDNTVKTIPFISGDEELEGIPEVPPKTGYTGSWESYSLNDESITINAVYTPIQYKATFVADGKTVGEIPYTVETTAINPPAIPTKAGYSGSWNNYTLKIGGITVNALYSPYQYKATFVADDKIIEEIPYTVETTAITPPAVPVKAGYTGSWSNYTLKIGGITVNADYSVITTLSGPGPEHTVDCKNHAEMTALAKDLPDGYHVAWFKGGTKVLDSETYTSDELREQTVFTAKIIDDDGNVLKNSDGSEISKTVKVKVDNGFFKRIVAFFRQLLSIGQPTVTLQ